MNAERRRAGTDASFALVVFDPKIVSGRVAPIDIDELGQFVQRLSLAGVDLFPDDTLELHLRNVAGLPAPDPNRPPRVEPEQNTGDAGQDQ